MQDNRRSTATLLLLVLFFLYLQSVFMPFFFGKPQPPTPTTDAPLQGSPSTDAGTSSTTGVLTKTPPAPIAPPTPESLAAAPKAPGVTAEKLPAPAALAAGERDEKSRYPSDQEVRTAGTLEVVTPTTEATVSLLGGRITRFVLKNYAASSEPASPPLDLIDHVEFYPYPLGVYTGGVDDAWVRYRVMRTTPALSSGALNVTASENGTVILQGELPDGRSIKKEFTFTSAGHLVDFRVELGAPAKDHSRLEVEWAELVPPDKAVPLIDPYNVSQYVWFDGERAHRETFSTAETEQREHSLGNVLWVGQGDKYFTTTMVSPTPAAARTIKYNQFFSSRIQGDDTGATLTLYLGPKSYRLLKNIGHELQRTIDFGWTGIVSANLLFLLEFLFGIFGNYGVAIVALTVIVRGLLFPLNMASYKQMKAMQDLQPEMKRIRETIKDKQQQQQELLGLYRKRGVNPVGGCLPMLFQFPIFVGLYYSLQIAVELRHAPFAFWLRDLSAPEHLTLFGIPFPVMIILWVVTLLIQQWMMPATGDPSQKKIMMVMSVVFGFMLTKCPTGVTLYLLTSNFISMGQQHSMKGANGRRSLLITAAVSVAVLAVAWIFSKIG